ncbi:MAG TPA: hypothetical protein ENN19_16090 [Chloroflexi bacterium]|nr:hypothetical protein [Chloroflexota bacterium]
MQTCRLAYLLTCKLAHLLTCKLAHLLTCKLAHLCVRDRHVRHMDRVVARCQHRLSFPRQWILRPDLLDA